MRVEAFGEALPDGPNWAGSWKSSGNVQCIHEGREQVLALVRSGVGGSKELDMTEGEQMSKEMEIANLPTGVTRVAGRKRRAKEGRECVPPRQDAVVR
jgi:hypothetical protein